MPHPAIVTVEQWRETQLVTADMRRRRVPGWDRVGQAAAQHGVELVTVGRSDTHVLYEVGGRRLVLPRGHMPAAVADEVVMLLQASQ